MPKPKTFISPAAVARNAARALEWHKTIGSGMTPVGIRRAVQLSTGDHFPVPADCGGTQTVDCCESCHDMKDRFSFDKWPVEWTAKILADFPKLSRETRIFLARATALLYRHLKSQAKSQSDS